MGRKRNHLRSVGSEDGPNFDDEDYDGDGEKDYSVLNAAADKIRADGRIAVRKLAAWEESDEMLERANEITAWKRRSSTP